MLMINYVGHDNNVTLLREDGIREIIRSILINLVFNVMGRDE
jgi:hypothetical protein